MKILVINLATRKDRLSFMEQQLTGYEWERIDALNGYNLDLGDFSKLDFKPFSDWRDPLLGRQHTNTDLAAMISHFRAWELCANTNQPVLILEDDAEKIGDLDLAEIETLLKDYDVVYLDHREMIESKIKNIDSKFFVPYYPYWNSAYAISPSTAKKIIGVSNYRHNLIPVDEFFPITFGVNYSEDCLSKNKKIINNFNKLQSVFTKYFKLKPIAYTNKVFKQKSRSELGSDIESGKIMNTAETVHHLTVATDITKLTYLNKSVEGMGSKFVNLGQNVVWTGGDMSKPGGGMKINLVKQYIKFLPDNEIIFFVDGYDVFINDNTETIIERFKGFDVDVLFAAEKNCWPSKEMEAFFPKSNTDYNFLNSGVYIGYVKGLKTLFNLEINDSDDDQLYLQKQYIKAKIDDNVVVALDHENYIFQCLAGAEKDIEIKTNRQILNVATRCCPCVLHGNGGNNTKGKFDILVNNILGTSSRAPSKSGVEMIHTKEFTEMAPGSDILEIDFMTPENCQKLIDLAERHGKWESMYGDKFPGQEIRVREFSMDFWNELEEHFKTTINPIIEKYWWPLLMYGLRDAFIIKYDQKTQSNLKCHHDASLVSGMVKLNDGYTGGETYFYRQNLSNINTSVGKMILWPGQVTHGHEGKTVHTGTKYNLVIWTSRHRSDLNY